MEYAKKIKKMLCKELDEYAMKQKLTGADLEMVWKLTDTVKNLDKIEALEAGEDGYSEARGRRYYDGGMSYDDDMAYSERRGRGRNAKRDSRGRYSSDGDSYDYDSYDDSDSSYRGRGYSRDGAKDHMMSKLGEVMESASPNEREVLKDAMRKIEKM